VRGQRLKRAATVAWWRVVNPPTRPLAGIVPWWVLLETTGARTGRTRRTPLAAGPKEPDGMWLIAVHGRHAGWVCNLEADARVRLRHRRRWRSGAASVHPVDPETLGRFNLYARSGPRTVGMDPMLVRIDYER
jgi:deazaflavin-dependent oxidoreductase (nitroreductase family)